MWHEGIDPELLDDFLTESGELIEQLDVDLVSLETSSDPALLDQIFRALHTIKGSASFLNLGPLTEFAHAAEDALNKLRKGEISVTAETIDAMLKSVDVLRCQLGDVAARGVISAGPAELIERLHDISEGRGGAGGAGGGAAGEASGVGVEPVEASGASGDEPAAFGGVAGPLDLPEQKLDVLPFMVSDLIESAHEVSALAERAEQGDRGGAGAKLTEIAESMRATAEFFEFETLGALVCLLAASGESADGLAGEAWAALVPRLQAAGALVEAFAEGLGRELVLSWPLGTFLERGAACARGEPDGAALPEGAGVEAVLAADGVIDAPAEAEAAAPSGPAPSGSPAAAPGVATGAGEAAVGESGGGAGGSAASSAPAGGEQTIRVEVERLETLLNLVGEMVLTKNQVMGLSKSVRGHGMPHEFEEHFGTVAGALDRLTSELQVGVMRTRMQPLGKLFGRYPRIIRDLARKTDKKIDLVIEGGDTEVDKSVLELLGDPLVHMLRNSADHGLEPPAERSASGKPEVGRLVLSAEHQGGHVRVSIEDDGRGIRRDVIAAKAVEKGLTTEDAVSQMSDAEVFRFIFAPGFSTAAQVSDLSGRGVGMDVVRTNIGKLGGTVNVDSKAGRGTTVDVMIPLTVAILPAMMVGVGAHEYAVPLVTIHEIVRPESSSRHTVAGRPVMRLRETVLPLLDMREQLGEPIEGDKSFVVVVAAGHQRAGLVVDRLIGQQEVVIKPLDDGYTSDGPFSGATIREDGGVSLILDVNSLVRSADLSTATMSERSAA